MKPTIRVFKGDTFSRLVSTPYTPLHNYQITAMGRTPMGVKLCDFTITAVDQVANPGGFLLSVDTSTLPIGNVTVDFKVVDISTPPPTIKHTSKFTIVIDGVITHD